uniref:Uncharacterized protein n=1 Tax=Manihot esculenta TaxID=3983 RepID=A0A2C9W8R2_MANES
MNSSASVSPSDDWSSMMLMLGKLERAKRMIGGFFI